MILSTYPVYEITYEYKYLSNIFTILDMNKIYPIDNIDNKLEDSFIDEYIDHMIKYENDYDLILISYHPDILLKLYDKRVKYSLYVHRILTPITHFNNPLHPLHYARVLYDDNPLIISNWRGDEAKIDFVGNGDIIYINVYHKA